MGAILLIFVVIDAVLPKKTCNTTIINIVNGLEGGSKYGGKVLSHYKVYLDDGTCFPIFIEDDIYFEVADTVILSRSLLLGKPTFILNKSNSYGSIPARGVFSYYFTVVILLFLSIFYGIRYRNNAARLLNASVFVIFLTAFTIALLILI